MIKWSQPLITSIALVALCAYWLLPSPVTAVGDYESYAHYSGLECVPYKNVSTYEKLRYEFNYGYFFNKETSDRGKYYCPIDSVRFRRYASSEDFKSTPASYEDIYVRVYDPRTEGGSYYNVTAQVCYSLYNQPYNYTCGSPDDESSSEGYSSLTPTLPTGSTASSNSMAFIRGYLGYAYSNRYPKIIGISVYSTYD